MATLRAVLFPVPPRAVPARRALGVALRTAHLVTFGVLLGGHAFDVAPARLLPFLVATIASGAGLTALELASTCAWLVRAKGLAVLAKLGLLLLVPVWWEQRVPLLVGVVVIASVAAHMPARYRYWSPLPRLAGPPEPGRPLPGPPSPRPLGPGAGRRPLPPGAAGG